MHDYFYITYCRSPRSLKYPYIYVDIPAVYLHYMWVCVCICTQKESTQTKRNTLYISLITSYTNAPTCTRSSSIFMRLCIRKYRRKTYSILGFL